eukprot:scaffold58788_cov66-Phaeocystis_antarctica.AAC.6
MLALAKPPLKSNVVTSVKSRKARSAAYGSACTWLGLGLVLGVAVGVVVGSGSGSGSESGSWLGSGPVSGPGVVCTVMSVSRARTLTPGSSSMNRRSRWDFCSHAT